MNRITVAWQVTLDMCQKSVKHDDMYGKWVLSTVAIIIFLLVKKRYPLPFGENYSLSFPVSPPFRVIFRIYFCPRHSGGWVGGAAVQRIELHILLQAISTRRKWRHRRVEVKWKSSAAEAVTSLSRKLSAVRSLPSTESTDTIYGSIFDMRWVVGCRTFHEMFCKHFLCIFATVFLLTIDIISLFLSRFFFFFFLTP